MWRYIYIYILYTYYIHIHILILILYVSYIGMTTYIWAYKHAPGYATCFVYIYTSIDVYIYIYMCMYIYTRACLCCPSGIFKMPVTHSCSLGILKWIWISSCCLLPPVGHMLSVVTRWPLWSQLTEVGMTVSNISPSSHSILDAKVNFPNHKES